MWKMLVLVVAALLAACSSTPTRTSNSSADETGMKNISFDMSPQAVLEKIKSRDIIVESTADRIVSEGPWDVDPSIRRKTFSFQESKLLCIRYEYVRGNSALPSITPTFCK